WLSTMRDEHPAVRDFDGVDHAELIKKFVEADRGHLTTSRARIIAALDSRRPTGRADAPESSEPAKLQRQVKKQKGHIALRKLFQEIPNLVQRLKPCFLMSPL